MTHDHPVYVAAKYRAHHVLADLLTRLIEAETEIHKSLGPDPSTALARSAVGEAMAEQLAKVAVMTLEAGRRIDAYDLDWDGDDDDALVTASRELAAMLMKTINSFTDRHDRRSEPKAVAVEYARRRN